MLISWAVGYLVNTTGIFEKNLTLSKTYYSNEVHPITGHEGPEGEWRYSPTFSLTSALDGVDGQRDDPAALPPGKTRYPLNKRLDRPQGRSGQVRPQNCRATLNFSRF